MTKSAILLHMNWFYERFTRTSEKNGLITCVRWFGSWKVMVGGCFQSGRYIKNMWRGALQKIDRDTSIKNVLILGLGGGGDVELLHTRFPGINLTVIEWDPIMIEISQRIHQFSPVHQPHILMGDASAILPTLSQTFDLIVFDLYEGRTTAPAAFFPAFSSALKHVSHPSTILLVNAYLRPDLFSILDKTFTRLKQWKYKWNHLAMYRLDDTLSPIERISATIL